MYIEVAVLALFTFLYSVIAGRLDKLPISGPIVFVLTGFLLGPLGLGVFSDDISQIEFRMLVDLTLALILFIDASNANTSILIKQWKIPSRLLAIGLPGAIGLGIVVGAWLLDSLTFFEAAILATMLAATDAALGKAVVTNEAVPARLREGLNCESGLNDGLCVPILLVFIAFAHGSDESGVSLALDLVTEELGIGMAVGLGIALVGAWVLGFAARREWVSAIWMQVSVPALAITCFAVAQSLHGSGYIAAFSGGLLFGYIARGATHKLVIAGEGVSESMAMLTWMIFGALVIGQSFEYFTPEILIYTILSLTVVRMLPIFLAMMGSGESTQNKLFLGWFGPRGLASLVFAIMVINQNLPGGSVIATVVTCTVGMSLVLHGITANPLATWIAGKQNA